MQLQNNVVGVNGSNGARTDAVLWYPELPITSKARNRFTTGRLR